MFYDVKITPEEEYLLSALVGESLEVIAFDGWSAEIRTADQYLHIMPEEVATPDQEHTYADVERVLIKALSETLLDKTSQLMAENGGKITEVNIISVLLTFSPSRMAGEATWKLSAGEITLPPGIAYDRVYYPPARKAEVIQLLRGDQAVVDLDIAIEVISERHAGMALYTDAYFIKVSANGLPDVVWAKPGYFSRRESLRSEAQQ